MRLILAHCVETSQVDPEPRILPGGRGRLAAASLELGITAPVRVPEREDHDGIWRIGDPVVEVIS